MNKKLMLMAALCAIALGSNAQTEKGKVLLGGALGFGTQKPNNDIGEKRSTGFNISPQAGIFISDNLVLGLGIYYRQSKQDGYIYQNPDFPDFPAYLRHGYKDKGVGLTPFARYYVGINKRFKFFGAAIFYGVKGSYKETDENGKISSTEFEYKYYSAGLSTGFAFFPTKHFAIEFSTSLLGYSKQKYSNIAEGYNLYDYSSFYFGLKTLTPSVGLNYHF